MIVMKFGGTSVANASQIQKVANIVLHHLDKRPLVVVSALAGVTNELLLLAEKASQGKEISSKTLLDRHLSVAHKLDLPPTLLQPFFHELTSLLNGIQLLHECTPRTLDRVLSFGEQCSSSLVGHFLKQKINIPIEIIPSYDLGLMTNSFFGQASPHPESQQAILKKVTSLPETLIITTGFIAKDTEGNVTTLGRGGSDFSASWIGAAIDAKEIQIWTDVSGILTADPRTVPHAQTLSELSFQEASELAYYGAKVIHPATMVPAMAKHIPVRILNTNDPAHPGTCVLPTAYQTDRTVKAIAHRDELSMVHVTSLRMLDQHGFLEKLFQVFSKHHISVDMISTSEVSVSLTVLQKDARAEALLELKAFCDVRLEHGFSVVSVVGEGLKEKPGIVARVFSTLHEQCIPVQMISLGASKINLSFLVSTPNVTHTVTLLHKTFFEN
ncbi:MAG: aspartate kinase [Deltaproteobacteria bacterium]|nr:aspartate kinase [Deltaproteobacteria bacterium]